MQRATDIRARPLSGLTVDGAFAVRAIIGFMASWLKGRGLPLGVVHKSLLWIGDGNGDYRLFRVLKR